MRVTTFYCHGATGCFILQMIVFHTSVNTQISRMVHKTLLLKAKICQRHSYVELGSCPEWLLSLFPPIACVVKCYFNV